MLHYPSIESWTLVNCVSCSRAPVYRRIQFHTIRKALKALRRQLMGAYAVFPYFTSHFGHWVGDQLGAILWFASNPQMTAGGRRLLVTAPSPVWVDALQQLCPSGSLACFTPLQLLEANLELPDALLLPRLSIWQNPILARDLLQCALTAGSAQPECRDAPSPVDERLFLCSRRSDRIVNLDEVCTVFERNGYVVLDPAGLPSLLLLRRLREAAQVWSEHGSMVLNLLICRSGPYHLLALDPFHARVFPPALSELGGGLYNNLQSGLQQPFPCAPADISTSLDRRLHPCQRQLRVDLDALEAATSTDLNSL